MRSWSSAALAALFCLATAAGAQDFRGLRLGEPAAGIARFGSPAAQEISNRFVTSRWLLPGGLELSVTGYFNGPIVYMESFRSHGGVVNGGEGLRFGATTRDELLALLGNPGFNYATRPTQTAYQGNDVFFHSYELANEPGTIVTFAFARPTGHRGAVPDGGAVLDSIVVARAEYLAEIWGAFLPPPANYDRITLSY